MSSKKQTHSLRSNKTEQKSGLASHYRAIGIKAVAAATRKSRDETAKTSRRSRREVKRRMALSASDQVKLQALTPQQRLVVEDALAFFPQLTLDEILSELSLLM